MSDAGPRVRFAPSPTGSLHLGNARTALFNWLVARSRDGTFVLRVEDTDTERAEVGSEASILDDLRWLGLTWDEGPDIGGPSGPYRQSERGAFYQDAVDRLLSAGRAYRCFCTEDDLVGEREARTVGGRGPGYSGRCRRIPAAESEARAASGEPFAIRFLTLPVKPSAADLVVAFRDRLRGEVSVSAVELGDPVLVRRDGRPTYNFAVVVDDIAMGIDLVLRGDDHLSNTPRQVLVYRALGAAIPEFAHLPMVRGPDGERLSKRHGATSVSEFRRTGYPSAAVVNALALMGWAPSGDRTVVSLPEILDEFDLARVGRSPAIFDPAKLDWISGQHVHRLPAETIAAEAAQRLGAAGALPPDAAARGARWFLDLAEMLKISIGHFGQIPARCEAIFRRPDEPPDADASAVLASAEARAVVAALAAVLDRGEPETTDDWKRIVAEVQARAGFGGKPLYHALRAALTGKTGGPALDRLAALIGSGARLFPGHIAGLSDRLSRVDAP